jgi:hypothetical protein
MTVIAISLPASWTGDMRQVRHPARQTHKHPPTRSISSPPLIPNDTQDSLNVELRICHIRGSLADVPTINVSRMENTAMFCTALKTGIFVKAMHLSARMHCFRAMAMNFNVSRANMVGELIIANSQCRQIHMHQM